MRLLFHKDIYLPEDFNGKAIMFQRNSLGYEYSEHIVEHMIDNKLEMTDRSHKFKSKKLFACVNSFRGNPQLPFEVAIEKDFNIYGDYDFHLCKYCVRTKYDNTQDLVVVFAPYFDRNKKEYDWYRTKVVTVWLNDNNDSHKTLDNSKYCSEEEYLKEN